MVSLIQFIKGLTRRFIFHPSPYPVTLTPEKSVVRGHVLLSYLEYALLWPDNHVELTGHSNRWECREIARIFAQLGFSVDGISFKDNLFIPSKKYDVLFDISTNLQRLAPLMDSRTFKILHRTGSDAFYQNRAEMGRVTALESRRGRLYSPKRMVAFPDLERKSLEIADVCSLIGNRYTLATYPETFMSKIRLTTVSGSELSEVSKTRRNAIPALREFLFFSGSGMVHKGLDLLLEVFARDGSHVLNVVGSVEGEQDFCRIYNNELTTLPNIRYHGFLKANSIEFQKVLRNSFCFIAPSCSEGMSSSVVTCLQAGLYPIISRSTGVTLPDGCGLYLESCLDAEITRAIEHVSLLPDDHLVDQIRKVQSDALQRYTRQRFRETMEKIIGDALLERF